MSLARPRLAFAPLTPSRLLPNRTRDLSLVEQVKGTGQGTILFASTSVVSPIVPRVSGRVRASIALNGWVLEPIPGGTKITYYLHVDVKTFVPAFAAMKYLVSFRPPPPRLPFFSFLDKIVESRHCGGEVATANGGGKTNRQPAKEHRSHSIL